MYSFTHSVIHFFFDKKVGDFNKMESTSLDFTGLRIPRDY
ncbi:endoribonuclease L-PSP [Hungatella hathewayi]|nr:endoribonuclease L-PSP [Hungatella hathewayi]